MGDPICKWRAARPHNVVDLVNNILPHSTMSEEMFRQTVESIMPGFMHTPYQLACQLGLYAVVDGVYYPRFTRDITDEEALSYLEDIVSKYYVPNPYTPRGFKNLESPVLLESSIVEYLEKYPNQDDIEFILRTLLKEEVGNLGATKTLLSYSKLFTITGSTIALNPNYKELMNIANSRSDKKAFFEFLQSQMQKQNIKEPLQLIYYGAPGTGKSHAIDGVVSEDNSVRTTFHPDSDYASFVGAYKPTMASVAMSAFVGKEVHKAQPQGGHPGTEQKIVYKYVPQAFLKAYVQAWAKYNPENDEPYYLVIEEINRGNCAQIFGDLFQLLDRNNMGASSYPITADEDIEQFLATEKKGFEGLTEKQKEVIRNFVLVKDNGKAEYIGESILNGSKLLLPPNLRIWATMNTSDQSLFPIDSAFKRRWNWKYMPIEYNPVDHNGNIISWSFKIGESQFSWGAFLEKINPEIYTLTESSDKQMGYFFAKADPQTGIISEDVFLNKVLFYLWTDVFKDYDVSSAVFKNKKENRSFRFTDFFEDPEALGNFIENLGLLPLDENDNIGDLEESNSAGFSLNGEALSLKDIANKVVSNYATEHPELTGEAIRDTFVSLCKGIGVSHIVESDEDYQKRRHQPSAERSRTAVILPNGETIHVTTQWRANKPDSNFIKFIEICKEHNLGIIERIVE